MKKTKVPRLFGVQLPARVFEKRILPRIYIPSDREYLQGLYVPQVDGSYRRTENPDPEAAARLRELARAVARNRGVVRLGKISVIAVLAVGLSLFNLFFRDRLAEAGLERALEGIFSARAEVDHLRVRLSRGRVSFHHLAVADQEQPMRNLFELGRSALGLDVGQLLRGRVLVRQLESRDIRWGTPRATSGALAPRVEPSTAQGSGGAAPALPGLDVRALLDEQAANLRSPAAAAQISARATEMNTQWGERLEAAEETLRRLSDEVEGLRSLEVASVRTVAEAQQALRQLQGLSPALQDARRQVAALKEDLATDAQALARARRGIPGLVEQDVAYLAGLADLSGSGLRGLLASLAAPQLERYLGRCSSLALRALGFAQRLVSPGGTTGRKPHRGLGRSPGRMVRFPARRVPSFLLEQMTASFGARGEADYARFSMSNLSSDPELTAAPVSVSAELAREERTLTVAGRLDLREAARERVGAGLEVFGQPLELSEGLQAASLRRVRGRYDLRSDLSLDAGGNLRGSGRLTLRDLVLEREGSGDPVSAAVYNALSASPELTIAFRFASDDGALRVTASTNLDDALSAQLRDSLAALRTRQEQRLREELRRRLEGELARSESLSASLSALLERTDGRLQDVGGYEQLVAQKRSELEARVRRLGGGVLQGLPGGLRQ